VVNNLTDNNLILPWQDKSDFPPISNMAPVYKTGSFHIGRPA